MDLDELAASDGADNTRSTVEDHLGAGVRRRTGGSGRRA